MSRIGKATETGSRLVVAWEGAVEGEGGMTAEGYWVSLWGTENILELIVVLVVQL